MITFVTNFDEATEANYNIYNTLEITPTISLTGVEATATNLSTELSNEERDIFAMSHGDNHILYDQNGVTTFSEHIFEQLELTDINIFSFACNTSNLLGEIASRNSCNWLGFAEPINPPEQDEELHDIYKSLFEYIISTYTNVKCEGTASQFLNDLKNLCEQKAEEIDSLIDSENFYAPIAAYQSIKQIWEKQKIWLANITVPIMHDDAPVPIIW
jgi:hypothetical protein